MPDPTTAIIIPALNEERAIGRVVASVIDRVDRVVVADNGSTDATAEVARHAGARVVSVPEPGYGRACLAGMDATRDIDIIVFMDGDASDDPADLDALLAPIRAGEVAFTLGSRLAGQLAGQVERGALTLPQRFGNTLACTLMRLIWNSRFTDLGPFRAITRPALDSLGMQAPTFGWTVEMQVRLLKHAVPYREVPVRYRRRIGTSKISGTLRGVVLAGWYILGTIAVEALRGRLMLTRNPKPKPVPPG